MINVSPEANAYGYSEMNGTYLEKCEPIPLTPELLERIGFEKKDEDSFAFEHNNADYVIEKQDDWYFVGVSLSGITNYLAWHIYHLHQLQNLYFALTNTDLEITEQMLIG